MYGLIRNCIFLW